MRIRTFSDPVLRRPAAPVKRIGWATRRLAAGMAETMRRCKGVGLAAPQVGVLSRLIVADIGEGLWVLANPKITLALGRVTDWEGCLSFPGLLAEVERAEKVTVEAVALDGKTVRVDAEGFWARVLQHEIDHLDGIVILDRARSVEKVKPTWTTEGQAEPRSAARPLRVAFMGTPSFAVPTLEALVAAGHTVVGVVTRPDRPGGRGTSSLRPSPVKRTALALGLPVWQGEGPEAKARLAGLLDRWEAEAAVVVAYGVILPPEVLTRPRLGCLNLHASLLPDYRGPAPIQRALMDGCTVTGVTVIRMDEGVDTGDIVAQREVPIAPDEDAGGLHDRLAVIGAELVLEALDLLATGKAAPRPQPPGRFRPAPRLGPADEVIDWRRPAADIALQIRAMAPVPGVYTVFNGRRVKILRAEVLDAVADSVREVRRAPGRVIGFDAGAPVVAAGDKALALRVVQPAGGQRMSGADFVNGYRVRAGESFEGRPDLTNSGGE